MPSELGTRSPQSSCACMSTYVTCVQHLTTVIVSHFQRRWRLMLKCVPDGADRDFADCIDYLVEAYTPDLKLPKGAATATNAPAEAAA